MRHRLFILFGILFGTIFPIGILGFSPLQKIVTSQAIFDTFVSRFPQEVFSENVLLQQFTVPHLNLEYLRSSHGIGSRIYCAECFINTVVFDLFYFGLFVATLYAQYSLATTHVVSVSDKLGGVNVFLTTRRITRFVLLVFFFIFTKDVNNAI